MTRFASANLTSYLALASAMFIVGTSVVASKIVVDTLPIFTGSAIRFLIAAVILLAIVGRAGGIPRLPARLHLIIALQALAGIVLFNALLMLGLDLTTAIASGIITSTTPAVIAMMSLALGDRLRLIGWIGVTLAVLGVVIVNLFGTADAGSATRPLLGATLVFLAVVGEALYTVLGKIAAPALKPVPMATLVTVYGFILFLPFAATDIAELHPSDVPLKGWLAIVYLALIVTVVAFALWFHGLQHVPASTAGAFTGMIPVGTIVATAIFLDEPVQPLHLAGMAVVIAGIVLVARGPRASTAAPDDNATRFTANPAVVPGHPESV
jgi:drug/metabolite transporter (DMT)-like permease